MSIDHVQFVFGLSESPNYVSWKADSGSETKFGYRTLQMQKEVQDKNFFEAKNSNGMSDLAKCQTCGLRVNVNCCQW